MKSYLSDFNVISKTLSEQDRAQALDDLNNEMAGREVGRTSRFLTRSDENGLVGGKRGQNAGHGLSALDIMLTTSPEYFALHADLSGDLRNAQDRNHGLDERLESAIEAARRNLGSITDQAVLLPNGERAFMDEDGVAWTEDDRRIDPAITEGIDWTGRPLRATYLDARNALTELQDAQDENRLIGVRLGEIDNTIHDDDAPVTMDEMRELHDEVEAIQENMDRLETHLDSSWQTEHVVEAEQPTLSGVTASIVPIL